MSDELLDAEARGELEHLDVRAEELLAAGLAVSAGPAGRARLTADDLADRVLVAVGCLYLALFVLLGWMLS